MKARKRPVHKSAPVKTAKRQKSKMVHAAVSAQTKRIDALKQLLAKERAETLARVKELMREQARNGGQPPADEMDVARSLAEVETHAALFDRAQERLGAIDAAIARLGAGVYGTCARCGDEIPLARLHAVPFAQYCVDCQHEINNEARSGQGGGGKVFGARWSAPEDIVVADDADEHVDPVRTATDDDVQIDSAFGPDEDELESTGVEKRRRGRPPKPKKPTLKKAH
jgi:DnaK suppressor protein